MIFKQGDIILANFDPVQGREQAGLRPALVVSKDELNTGGICTVVPITSKDKNFLIQIPLDERTKTYGNILINHVRTVDLNARRAKKLEECPEDILLNVLSVIRSMF